VSAIDHTWCAACASGRGFTIRNPEYADCDNTHDGQHRWVVEVSEVLAAIDRVEALIPNVFGRTAAAGSGVACRRLRAEFEEDSRG
jgi:hypothetical protein